MIDGNERREVREAPGPVLALYLTTPLSIGELFFFFIIGSIRERRNIIFTV